MLVRMRKLLAKNGKLTAKIIDASVGLPSVSAYLVHFGTLRNAYRLIGYTGNQRYWDKLATHKQWVDLHLENATRLGQAFEKAGRRAALDPSTDCLRIDRAVNICFRIAKWRMYEGRPLRWTIMRRVRSPQGWVVVLRLGENNEALLDYLLLPSVSLASVGRLLWFSEDTRAAHGIERFETFGELSRSLIKRIGKAAREPRAGSVIHLARAR